MERFYEKLILSMEDEGVKMHISITFIYLRYTVKII